MQTQKLPPERLLEWYTARAPYDERNPAFQKGGDGCVAFVETRQALKVPSMLRGCSWQRIIRHLRSQRILPWLTDQLELKYGL